MFFMPKIQILTHKFTKYVTFIKMNFWRKNGLLEQCVLLLHTLAHVLWQTRWKSGSFTRIPPISNQKGSWTLQEFFSRSDASSIFLGCRGSGGKSVGSAKKSLHWAAALCSFKRTYISQAKMRSWELPFTLTGMKQWTILTPHHNPISMQNLTGSFFVNHPKGSW